jgi:hypothetical protein
MSEQETDQPFNPYAAPASPLEGDFIATPFYVVSAKKFWLLFVLTFGFYVVAWMYLHWDMIRKRTNESLWPAPRAFFDIFFYHALLERFQHAAFQKSGRSNARLFDVATAIVIVSIVIRCINAYSNQSSTPGLLALVPVVLLLVQAWLMYFAQRVANYAAGDSLGESNSTLTPTNVFWMALGGLWWLLVLLGSSVMLFGEQAADIIGA